MVLASAYQVDGCHGKCYSHQPSGHCARRYILRILELTSICTWGSRRRGFAKGGDLVTRFHIASSPNKLGRSTNIGGRLQPTLNLRGFRSSKLGLNAYLPISSIRKTENICDEPCQDGSHGETGREYIPLTWHQKRNSVFSCQRLTAILGQTNAHGAGWYWTIEAKWEDAQPWTHSPYYPSSSCPRRHGLRPFDPQPLQVLVLAPHPKASLFLKLVNLDLKSLSLDPNPRLTRRTKSDGRLPHLGGRIEKKPNFRKPVALPHIHPHPNPQSMR
jgi:hypothetical protein